MRKIHPLENNGVEAYEPTDPNDIAFLQIAEGAKFQQTIFPSGWVSPDEPLVCKDGQLVKEWQMNEREERGLFARWWLWILLLIVVSMVFLGSVGLVTRFFGVVGERVIFENSFQRSAAEESRMNALQSELTAIETRLRGESLSETQRADLEAQAAGLRYQIGANE